MNKYCEIHKPHRLVTDRTKLLDLQPPEFMQNYLDAYVL